MLQLPKKNGSKSGISYDPTADPPANPTDLQAAINDIDRQIAAHQQLLRGAALTVYQPLIDQALQRIQAEASKQLVPPGAQPVTIKGLPIGSVVTVTQSPPVAGVVLDHRIDPATGKPVLIVLTRDRGIVSAFPEEVTMGPPTSTSSGASIETSSSAPESSGGSAQPSTPQHSIHAGDLVQTPMGIGRVSREPVTGTDLVDVDLGPVGKFVLRRSEISVVPPPAPAPSGGVTATA